ncbi:transcriptional regulator [Pelomonas sp. HMWF004]|nr:transcriptional regulator [Pelomonas sp. HMWF004]
MLKDHSDPGVGASSPNSAKAGRYRQDLQPLHAVQIADALLRIKTVTQATGLSAATLYRKLAAGEFPEPVRLGTRCTRWKAADVRAWIQAQGGAQ